MSFSNEGTLSQPLQIDLISCRISPGPSWFSSWQFRPVFWVFVGAVDAAAGHCVFDVPFAIKCSKAVFIVHRAVVKRPNTSPSSQARGTPGETAGATGHEWLSAQLIAQVCAGPFWMPIAYQTTSKSALGEILELNCGEKTPCPPPGSRFQGTERLCLSMSFLGLPLAVTTLRDSYALDYWGTACYSNRELIELLQG